jgi:hypothetical protein
MSTSPAVVACGILLEERQPGHLEAVHIPGAAAKHFYAGFQAVLWFIVKWRRSSFCLGGLSNLISCGGLPQGIKNHVSKCSDIMCTSSTWCHMSTWHHVECKYSSMLGMLDMLFWGDNRMSNVYSTCCWKLSTCCSNLVQLGTPFYVLFQHAVEKIWSCCVSAYNILLKHFQHDVCVG